MSDLKNIDEAWLNLDIGDQKLFNPFRLIALTTMTIITKCFG